MSTLEIHNVPHDPIDELPPNTEKHVKEHVNFLDGYEIEELEIKNGNSSSTLYVHIPSQKLSIDECKDIAEKVLKGLSVKIYGVGVETGLQDENIEFNI